MNTDFIKNGRLFALGAVFLSLGLIAIYPACLPDGEPDARSHAKQITSRHELIGGPTAVGEVGDFLLENDKIRVVVEDVGFASGSGLFGGSLIDIDRIHQNVEGSLLGGNGEDTFGEFFPAFFLEMINPEEVVVLNDGSDGEAAIVEVRGRGGEFVTMLRFINQAMINSYEADLGEAFAGNPANSDGEPLVRFSVRYILEPGASHVRVESSVINESGRSLTFPDANIASLLGSVMELSLDGFSVPLGSVLGFGKLNSPFLPEIGYDLRWGLEDSYSDEIELPAFPGKVTDFVASSNTQGTNYGFIAGRSEERSFVHNKDEFYGGETENGDMLMLFYASGFSGVLTHDMPQSLPPDDDNPETDDHIYTFTNYVIVGKGDVASILDEASQIRDVDTQAVSGRVFDEFTGEAVGENVSLLIYRAGPQGCSATGEAAPSIYSQAYTNKEGQFQFTLPAGSYCYRTRDDGRPLSEFEGFEIDDSGVYLRPKAMSPARLEARIVDDSGAPLPAKVMLVGTHEFRGDDPKRHFLFDLRAGEPWRTTDMIPDEDDDVSTRRYLEAIGYASADGHARLEARPGTYDVYISRGTEYELEKREQIELEPGKIRRFQVKLNREFNPPGYLSGDFHMHARGSIDSGLDFNERVISVAAEGVEVVAASDHNHVSDYMPYIMRNDLAPWLKSVVGVELTTFEFGHFNAFPVDYEVGSITGGSVPWQNLPPQAIFDKLRSNEDVAEGDTIIQINHPRDSILGYFGQYNVDPFDTSVSLPFQTAGGSGLVKTVSTSTGPAYMRNCENEDVACRGDKKYESTFSWDFDAIEVFNGKHLELLRHYRIPYAEGQWPEDVADAVIEEVCADEYEDEDPCPFGEAELAERYPEGAIMCDDDEVAFPGALDDWYNTLNYPREFLRGDDVEPTEPVYRKYTATGNSDSHESGKPEFRQPGSPRNYFWAGHDQPAQMKDSQLVRAMKGQRNIVTNGPFATMHIAEGTIGDEVNVDSAQVDIDVKVRAADWVGAERFRIVANGEPVEIDDDETPTVVEFELDDNGTFETTVRADIDKDTWFVLEVEGDNNLFPVYTPQEIPQVAFDAAIGSIAGSFGFGGTVEGLSPTETFALTPFAFTNPIFVVYDQGDDTDGQFTPPSPPPASCTSGAGTNALMDAAALGPRKKRRLDAVRMPVEVKPHHPEELERPAGEQHDLRILFENWGHSH
ncbi:MAG: hypothetical protein ACQEVA_00945 [Myxococcota bacterium]